MNFYKAENKKFSKENDRLRLENISYWLENSTIKQENEELKSEIKRLKEPTAILNINVTPEELAQKIVKELSKNEEHKCTSECFEK